MNARCLCKKYSCLEKNRMDATAPIHDTRKKRDTIHKTWAVVSDLR